MRKQWTGEARVALSALLLGTLTACGGGGGSNPAGSSGPTRTVISTQTGALAPQTADAYAVTVTASGTLDANVDWGSAGNDFDVFVTSNSCTTTDLGALERGEGSCGHITDARSTTSKPERVTWAGSASATYKVWVANFGRSTDSYTVTIGVTR